jgi:SpoVK/Ycf46/Vps4 family AAA+-type ATPase
VYAAPVLPPCGLLLELPEMRSDYVINLIEQFWNSEKDYKEGNEFVRGGAAYKAGIMLYGPAGTGKTCSVKIVANKMVERGGIVFYASMPPNIITHFLEDFSRIEGERKCIVILEDIDSLIHSFGEQGYLEMLDSAKTINNVLFIATTNYPDKLDPRIYNRPGRFSHVVRIGLPGEKAREAFLKAILKNHRDVPEIVSKTDGFSVDHLSAIVNSVYREGKPLAQEIERLRKLFKVPKSEDAKAMGI